jgi:hypothetical protein
MILMGGEILTEQKHLIRARAAITAV